MHVESFTVTTFAVSGPALIVPRILADSRGTFIEAFKAKWFAQNVADVEFVQDNQSHSLKTGTLRGLHYQSAPFGQGKLVRCLTGSIFDVCVDMRPGSDTYGQWVGATLTAAGAEQLWVPEGFAHGFCTLTPDTSVFYKVTSLYSPAHDKGIAFDDPDIGIDWPIDVTQAILSDKDKRLPRLKDLSAEEEA
jgi:dTDP-4-dehydrorhamnose 3,5-epimerase